jgi:hypothetical protein
VNKFFVLLFSSCLIHSYAYSEMPKQKRWVTQATSKKTASTMVEAELPEQLKTALQKCSAVQEHSDYIACPKIYAAKYSGKGNALGRLSTIKRLVGKGLRMDVGSLEKSTPALTTTEITSRLEDQIDTLTNEMLENDLNLGSQLKSAKEANRVLKKS